MAKFGYYKQGPRSSVLIQAFEGTGIRTVGGKPEVISIYKDHADGRRLDVATIHLNKGEWVAQEDHTYGE
jgi:hypothetical protein